MTQTQHAPHRRAVLFTGAALGLVAAAPALADDRAFANAPQRKISDDQWRRMLPPASYGVLRHEDTEQPYTSPLLNEHRRGTFACLGCGLPLFKSEWKYDSGTGWPSFFTAIDANLGRKADFKIIEERTEYHCARCLGHQGHVFDDGPRPTGLRYCNNGVALRFIPA
jgi:peptide-methionine (R)-S-oxide reductase